MDIIGTVTGIMPIQPYEFYVRLSVQEGKPVRMVQLDEVIEVSYNYDRFGRLKTYGIVIESVSRWDQQEITGYKEEIITSGEMIGIPIYLVKVAVTRTLRLENGRWVEDEVSVPPPAGTPVRIVEEEETDVALGFDKLKERNRALPVGLLINEHPAYLDVDYILGNNGAHINVSGLSGVAAKTSYTTFLLYSMLNSKHEELRSSRVIIFNVKGEGLLFLDKWNREWEEKKDEWEEMFEKMGLTPSPFENVLFYAPKRGKKGVDVNYRVDGKVKPFGWDGIDVVRLGLVEFLFEPAELSENINFQLTVSVIAEMLEEKYESLKRFVISEFYNKESPVRKSLGYDPTALSEDEKVRAYLENAPEPVDNLLRNYNIPNSIRELATMLKKSSNSDLVEILTKEEEVGEKTIAAIYRRIRAAEKLDIGRVWLPIERKNIFESSRKYEKPEYHIEWDRKGGITVIDISKLRHRAQIFVVGSVLKEVLKAKELGTIKEPVFIYLDELNKYAPRYGGGPLGNIFRDIAERGRSFKIILVGAEQTASEVDYRVVTQSATTVVGRQKLAELRKDEYAHLTGAQKERASHLVQGEVIIDQPSLRVPLLIKFPMTPWATKEGAENSEMNRNIFDELQ